MLLNFGLPTGKPTVTVAPKSTIDKDAILGLKPSQYEGLQSQLEILVILWEQQDV